MKLITAAIRAKLEKNFREQNDEDGVLKLFGGPACTWVITQLEPNGDTMWGLADLGMGCIEYGTISLSELQSVKFPPFGLGVERDMYFRGAKISELRRRESLVGC
jgi:hypothetical protein